MAYHGGGRTGGRAQVAIELERKFLVRDDSWRAQASVGIEFRQGYLAGNERCSVRVRVGAGRAHLNVKSATLGVWRQEFEYEIPLADADQMLDTLCEQPLIEKTRYHVRHGRHRWEIDVFAGENAGLVVAEVELASETEEVELPPWVSDEVSHDARYYNSSLARHPYLSW